MKTYFFGVQLLPNADFGKFFIFLRENRGPATPCEPSLLQGGMPPGLKTSGLYILKIRFDNFILAGSHDKQCQVDKRVAYSL